MTQSTIYNGYYNGYPVEFDGQWMKVLRHYSGTGEFWSSANNWEQAKWNNPDNPQANKYSILDYVKNFKFNGKYTFKLVYPQYKDRTNIWSQAQNPLDITEVIDGLTKIKTGWSGNYWGGLTRSSYSGTFLDGSNPHGNWYFAVGSAVSWSGSTTFPGPGAAVNTVELWVKAIDDTDNETKAIYYRGANSVPSNVDAKATLGEWDGTGSEPVSRASMVGLPAGVGQELQIWSNDGTTPRFYSAGQNPGELRHIASQLAGQKFNTPGDAITWLNSNSSYHLHNETLYPIMDGLVAAYDFANPDSFKNDGMLYDVSGQKRHAVGGSHDVEDVKGVKAYYFRGIERFRYDGSITTGANCTLESMIYADIAELTTGDRGTIIQGNIYMSWNKGNRRLSSYWYSTDNRGYHEPSLQMERERWYYLATVWDASTGTLKQYIDGVLQNTVSTSVIDAGNIHGINIGMEGESRQFSGAIAFANIYDKALTDSDIARNHEYYSKRIR